jgi:hypothetical protein
MGRDLRRSQLIPSWSPVGRGIGKRPNGALSGGTADLAADKTIDSGIEDAMTILGVRP